MTPTLGKDGREEFGKRVTEAAQDCLPSASLVMESTPSGVHIRVAMPYSTNSDQCTELTTRGKRCKMEKWHGDLCEAHYNMRQRRAHEAG